jgi:hypothetical protein
MRRSLRAFPYKRKRSDIYIYTYKVRVYLFATISPAAHETRKYSTSSIGPIVTTSLSILGGEVILLSFSAHSNIPPAVTLLSPIPIPPIPEFVDDSDTIRLL